MTNKIIIHVPAVPVAQPRQRHRIAGKGKKAFVVNYTPKDDPSVAFKATVRMAAEKAYSGPPLGGPLRVDCLFVMPRPQRLIWKKRPMPRVPHTKNPDIDNLLKATFDALSGLVIVDDAMIYSLNAEKFYASGDESPHVQVEITQHESTKISS